MSKLILAAFTKGMYDDKKACAYINYGTITKPVDHLNNPVGMEEEVATFIAHLQKVVVPLIKSALKNSKYKVDCIECENMVPNPFISISRTDGKSLTDTADMLQIKKLVDTAIVLFNSKQQRSALAIVVNTESKEEKKEEKRRTLRV